MAIGFPGTPALDLLPWPVAIVGADERVLYLNEACARWLDVDRDAVTDAAGLCRSRPRLLQAVRAAAAGGEGGAVTLPPEGALPLQVHVAPAAGEEGDGDTVVVYAEPIAAHATREHALRSLQAAWRRAQHQFDLILDQMPAAVFMLDTDLRLARANAAFERVLDVPVQAAVGKPVDTFLGPTLRRRLSEEYRQAMHSPAPLSFEISLRRSDGVRTLATTNFALRDEAGRPYGVVGIATDVTEQRRLEERVRHIAYHDAVTGLPNRRLFTELLDFELSQAKPEQHQVAVILLDLDRFKGINDSLGQDVGDLLLQQVARRLSERVRRSDVVARIGGDEFAVMLCDPHSPGRITAMAQQVLGAFRRPFLIGGRTLHVGSSMGISVFPDDADTPEALRRCADMAMYDAKRRGGSRFMFFNQEINTRSLRRMRTEHELRGAAERGELRVLFQPLVEAATGRVFSAEALVRWNHPQEGLLEPALFLPVAEETGLIAEIEEWVVHRACEEACRWERAAGRPLSVTVNLCARQFLRPDLPAVITDSLERAGLDPRRLQLEITEQVAMDDIARGLPQMHRLDELGVELALDDFGTGYSSLSYLKRMPVSLLKIDQAFVQDIASDPEDRSIVEAITALAHNMDISVLAEGVETEEQFELIRAARCDSAQGFLFDRPLEPERMVERLASARPPDTPDE